jgi:hypothetical protein
MQSESELPGTPPGSAPLGCYAAPLRVDARNLRAEIGGVEYEWGGGFGAIIKSRERGVKVGDMRMIGGVPFYAYMLHREWQWSKPEVWWSIPNPHLTSEWIRAFKDAVFSA